MSVPHHRLHILIKAIKLCVVAILTLFISPQFIQTSAAGTFKCEVVEKCNDWLCDNACDLTNKSCGTGEAAMFSDNKSCSNLTVSECTTAYGGNPHSCSTNPFTCNWAVINNPSSPANGHLGFCVGGFNSQTEANLYKFSLSCNFSLEACGAATTLSLWKNMSNLAIPQVFPDGQGKYFSCLTGPNGDEFERILKEMGRDSIKNSSAQCTVLGGAAGVGLFLASGGYAGIGAVAGGVTLATMKGVLVGGLCKPLISLLGGFTPNLTGSITGPNSCQANLAVKYDFSTDTVVPIDPVPGGDGTSVKTRKLCETVPLDKQPDCTKCFGKDPPGAWTAIGCIEGEPKEFVKKILSFAIGIAGGIAFLMILFGGFQVLTSAGDPEHMNAGKELIGAAVTGLLFIAFSLFILRIIGVSILGLPEFQ